MRRNKSRFRKRSEGASRLKKSESGSELAEMGFAIELGLMAGKPIGETVLLQGINTQLVNRIISRLGRVHVHPGLLQINRSSPPQAVARPGTTQASLEGEVMQDLRLGPTGWAVIAVRIAGV